MSDAVNVKPQYVGAHELARVMKMLRVHVQCKDLVASTGNGKYAYHHRAEDDRPQRPAFLLPPCVRISR